MVFLFPDRHVPVLFGICNVPMIALLWINQPLFSLMMNGEEKDFLPVNAGLTAVTGLTGRNDMITYHVRDGPVSAQYSF